MIEPSTHSQVLLAVLGALLTVSGAVAGAPATTVESSADGVSATIVHDGDSLRFHAAADQTVTVRTSADAGTELHVVLRESGDFSDVYGATVSEDGTATASLDLRHVEPGTNVSVTVRHEQENLARADGAVVNESVEMPTATTTVPTTYDESGFPFTSTATTTTATTTGDDATGDTTSEDTTDEVGVPGFGVPAALAALLAALALARRRR